MKKNIFFAFFVLAGVLFVGCEPTNIVDNNDQSNTIELSQNVISFVSYQDYSWNISIISDLDTIYPNKIIKYGILCGYNGESYQYTKYLTLDGNSIQTIEPLFIDGKGSPYIEEYLYWKTLMALYEKSTLTDSEQELKNNVLNYCNLAESEAKSKYWGKIFIELDGVKHTIKEYGNKMVGNDNTSGESNENNSGTTSSQGIAFSVSSDKKVIFSKGNLQYHPANNVWRFAPNQTDVIGYDNINIAPNYDGWIDLFSWGTGANPTKASDNDNDYPRFIDWGANMIESESPNTWRTLTYEEWYYLCYTRTNADFLVGVAQVNGVNGLIFLPDNWICPDGVTFRSGFHNSNDKESFAEYQTFTFEEWTKLELSGVIFLPAAGYRDPYDSSSRVCNATFAVQKIGDYWSATADSKKAYAASRLIFTSQACAVTAANRYWGHSVRLVKDL